MRRAAALAALHLAAAVLLGPLQATADAGCGGGSSGGGSSGSGGGSGGGGSGGGGSSDAACADLSDVVGFRNCRRFGSGWAASPVRLHIGPEVRWMSIPWLGEDLVAGHEDFNIPYRLENLGADGGGAPFGGFVLGLTGVIDGRFYMGGEVSIHMAGPGAPVQLGDLEVRRTLAGMVGAAITGGLSFRFGPLVVRGELALGGRLGALSYTTTHGTCVNTESLLLAVPVLEPRLRMDLFMSRFVSVGLALGANVASPGEMGASLNINFHGGSYDWLASE